MSEQTMTDDPRIAAVPDIHGHAKGEHKLFVDERPIPYTARMLFLWFFHACRRSAPRFLMVADHINYLTFEDPAAVNLVRRALKLAQAGDLYGAAETAGVDVQHAAVVGEGLRRGMRYSIGAEVDNDPRSRPDAQNIVDAMRPDGIVRSVHFLPIKHPQHGEWMWPFDNPEFRDVYDLVGTEQTWELYMATLLDAIEKLPGHIVGHFYVPAKFGHWPSDDALETYEDRLLDACAERGMAVEINSRYYYKHAVDDAAQLEKYSAANTRLMRKAKEKGVLVAVGSDAHSPKDQGRGFSEVLALLDSAGINEIAFPIDGRLARVALRATDELRRASSKATREERALTVPIPGTEEAESDETEDTGSDEAPERPAAAVAATPKKRPSRAKKPRAEAAPSDAVVPAAAAPEPEAAAEPAEKQNPAAAVVEAIAAVAKRVTQKLAETLQSHDAVPAATADSAESKAAAQEIAEPAPSEVADNEPKSEPKLAVAADPATDVAEPEAAAVNGVTDSDAAAADGAEPDAAVAAVPKPETTVSDAAEPKAAGVGEPEAAIADAVAPEAAVAEPGAQPVEAAAEAVPSEPAPLEPGATEPAHAETVATQATPENETPPDLAPEPAYEAPAAASAAQKVPSPKRDAALPDTLAPRIKRSRPATPAAAPKRSAKPVAKVVNRPKAAAKKSAPSKAGASKAASSKVSASAKKRVVKKAAASATKKVARPSRPVAKKAAAKKATPTRKTAKAPVKTASRSGAKKAGAKKTTAKKKATKSRR